MNPDSYRINTIYNPFAIINHLIKLLFQSTVIYINIYICEPPKQNLPILKISILNSTEDKWSKKLYYTAKLQFQNYSGQEDTPLTMSL